MPVQRASFFAFAEMFPEPMLLLDARGVILSATSAATRDLGLEGLPEGSSLADLALDPPSDIAHYLRMCARTRQAIPGAITMRRAPHPVRYRTHGARYVTDAADEACAVVLRLAALDEPSRFALLTEKAEALTQEITRRAAADEALAASEEWLRVVLTSIGDAVIATDRNGLVLFMNTVAERLTGWPLDEARRRPLDEVFAIVNEHTKEIVESPVRRVLRERSVVGLANHTLLIQRGGEEIPIDDSGAPICRGGSGEIHGVVLVFREISERKHAERERERLLSQEHDARLVAERALAQAEAANRAKDEFLSTLSHELRTPLTAILGWANILRTRAHAPVLVERALATIERNATAQARLVEDILDVSRIVTGKLRLSVAHVDIAAVARAAIDVVRPSAELKGITLDAQLDGGMIIDGDADRLQQIIWNLLSNAVKFTPSKGRIDLASRRVGARCELRVTDTGAGISAQFLPRIFDRFSQADASYTRPHGGLGLGLALAKHLAELHGGTVSAESQGPGRGATFVVRLPILAARSSPDTALLELPSAAPRGVLRGLAVLVIDDQPDVLDVVAAILHDEMAVVTTARSAAEALCFLAKTDVDVLVSDIGMPDEDGYAFLHKARLLLAERGRYVPALALTAYASLEHAKASYDAGFEGHLAKPVVPEVLTAAVARLAKR